MTGALYKAVGPDGTSFHDATFRWPADPVHDPRCGQPTAGGGAPRGWVLVRVIGHGAPRRYCGPAHARDALGVPAGEPLREAPDAATLRRAAAPRPLPAPGGPGRDRRPTPGCPRDEPMSLYKAVGPDGTSFHDPTFRWLREDGRPYARPVRHPKEGGLGYLSASTVETDCIGFRWPCRLLTVEPVGDVWTPEPADLPHKRAALAWRVTGELPAWRVFGPQGQSVVDLIERAGRLTPDERARLNYAWDDTGDAAIGATWEAAYGAHRAAAWFSVWGTTPWWPGVAAGAAAIALIVRDRITPEDYQAIAGPWQQVIR